MRDPRRHCRRPHKHPARPATPAPPAARPASFTNTASTGTNTGQLVAEATQCAADTRAIRAWSASTAAGTQPAARPTNPHETVPASEGPPPTSTDRTAARAQPDSRSGLPSPPGKAGQLSGKHRVRPRYPRAAPASPTLLSDSRGLSMSHVPRRDRHSDCRATRAPGI